MFESYRYQMEAMIHFWVINKYDNGDMLILYCMGNHNPEGVSPFNVPYFGLSLEDMSNMDDESYIPREFKFCRISMLEPKILGIEDENFIPNKEQIEILYNWLRSPYRYEWYNEVETNKSGWKQLIDVNNDQPGAYKNPSDLPIPNYLEMKL